MQLTTRKKVGIGTAAGLGISGLVVGLFVGVPSESPSAPTPGPGITHQEAQSALDTLQKYVNQQRSESPTPTPTPSPTPTLTTAPPTSAVPTPTTAAPTPTPTTAVPTPTGPAPVGWTLQYSTTFNNLTGWTIYNNQTQGNDNSVNLAKNITSGADGLNILGKKEAGFSRPYTSGEIVGKTTQLVVPNYFRAEVTCRFQDIKGIWPACLWFRPNNATDGEIDVMEWFGGLWAADQKRVAVTMHNEYGATQDSIKKPVLLRNNTWYDPNVPHTYTLEKVPNRITVWIDGRQVATFGPSDKTWWNRIMEVPGRTWYPRITLQIGSGANTQAVPNPDASFTESTVNVSSLKLWRLAG